MSLSLSNILPSTGQNKHYGNISLCVTSVFTFKMADHNENHRCHIETNVPKVFILPSRWHDGAESLGIDTTR